MSTLANITAGDEFFRAEDKNIIFTVMQADGVTPQNITGWTITFRMTLNMGGAAVITKSATLTTPLSGICTVTLASADTTALVADTTYLYDLRRTDSGSRSELAFGTIVIQETYTNG